MDKHFKVIEYKEDKNKDDYIELKKKALEENYDNNFLFGTIKDIKYHLFMVYNQGKAVGFLGYKRKSNEKMNHNYLILNGYIDSDYQSKGLGVKLYNYIEKIILDDKHKVTRIYSKVTETNVKSIGFFKKIGFNQFGKESHSIYDKNKGEYLGSLVFEKIIFK